LTTVIALAIARRTDFASSLYSAGLEFVVKFSSSAALSSPASGQAALQVTKRILPAENPLTVLIVVPTLQAGAAEAGAVELVHILAAAGHRPIVVSHGGRMEDDVTAAGAELVLLNVASKNPLVMLRNAVSLTRLVRARRCDVVHAHGRAPAWSAYIAARWSGVPLLTSWYKAFNEQNAFKRLYNSVMARGDRVVAVSDQIAEIINERYRTPWERIAVVPASVDIERFDPAAVARERIEAVRAAWGVERETKVILVIGRMLRRKGHHVVVGAARRLKEMGLKDFLFVFIGEDHGRTRYSGEVWDLVLASQATDVVRMAGPPDDLPAAYAGAAVVLSAAIQPEGLQRAILEAQAMARPVVVSDLGAGPEVVLAPPAVSEDRMTGLRFSAGNEAALATALIRLFSLPESARRGMGAQGREWVLAHFNAAAVAEQTLRLYAKVARGRAP
jgi:glycosyltransferase involved in cell wall biosynthesis